jgi:hypothetical protein
VVLIVQDVESVASNPPFTMTAVGEGMLELEMELVDSIVVEDRAVDEAASEAEIVVELSMDVGDIDKVAPSVVEIVDTSTVLDIVDERDEFSSEEAIVLGPETSTVEEGEEDNSTVEFGTEVAEDAILEIRSGVLMTGIEEEDALGFSDGQLTANSLGVVMGSEDGDVLDETLLDAATEEVIDDTEKESDTLEDAPTTSEEIEVALGEGDALDVATLDCMSE